MGEYNSIWVYVDRGLSAFCVLVFVLLIKMAATHFRAFKSVGRRQLWKVELWFFGVLNLIGLYDLLIPVSEAMMLTKGVLGVYFGYKIWYLNEEYKPMPATSSAENDFENAAYFDWPEILSIVKNCGGSFTNYGVQVDLLNESDTSVELTYTVLEDTHNFPWHYHREEVEHTVLKGAARFTERELSEGEKQVKPFGQVHNFFARKGTIVHVVVKKILS